MPIFYLTEKSVPAECYIFKHSDRCPVSLSAARVVEAHKWDLPLYWVNVIEQRELSNWVAEFLSIKHESPQLLLIKDNQLIKVLNHGGISERNINS